VRCGCHPQSQSLTPPYNLKHIHLTGFHFAEGIRVIVNVFDVTIADLDDTVAGLESCLGRGLILSNAIQ